MLDPEQEARIRESANRLRENVLAPPRQSPAKARIVHLVGESQELRLRLQRAMEQLKRSEGDKARLLAERDQLRAELDSIYVVHQQILDLLARIGPADLPTISNSLNLPESTAKKLVNRLFINGMLLHGVDGTFSLTATEGQH